MPIYGDTKPRQHGTLIHIPTGHMRFVPMHNISERGAHNLTSAKWPVEIVLIAKAEEKSQLLNIGRVHDILGPAI